MKVLKILSKPVGRGLLSDALLISKTDISLSVKKGAVALTALEKHTKDGNW
jgi:hypothetical protein